MLGTFLLSNLPVLNGAKERLSVYFCVLCSHLHARRSCHAECISHSQPWRQVQLQGMPPQQQPGRGLLWQQLPHQVCC
jgi:hypothetical protein